MCSTRDRFVLNVRLTASKNHIQGKLDFYSETASHVSSGFSPLQTKGPPAYSKSGAVTSNICWEWGRGTAVGAASHCPPLTSWSRKSCSSGEPRTNGASTTTTTATNVLPFLSDCIRACHLLPR